MFKNNNNKKIISRDDIYDSINTPVKDRPKKPDTTKQPKLNNNINVKEPEKPKKQNLDINTISFENKMSDNENSKIFHYKGKDIVWL